MTRRRSAHISPRYSLADLIGAVTIFFLSLPPLLVIGKVLITQGILAILLLVPFFLPSIVTGMILWSVLMEKLSLTGAPAGSHQREHPAAVE